MRAFYDIDIGASHDCVLGRNGNSVKIDATTCVFKSTIRRDGTIRGSVVVDVDADTGEFMRGPLTASFRLLSILPALLGRPLRLSLLDPSEDHFWPESGRRLSSGLETTGNRYQIAVRIQWTLPALQIRYFFC